MYEGKIVEVASYELSDSAKNLLIESHGAPKPEQQVINWYAKDLYSRWLNVPAGSLLVGEIHKFEHFFLILTVLLVPNAVASIQLKLLFIMCILLQRCDENNLCETELC